MVLAKEAGLCYASLALVTDYDSWREDTEAVSGTSQNPSFEELVLESLVQYVLTAHACLTE